MSKIIEDQLRKAEKQLEETTTRMEELRRELTEETKQFLIEWFPRYTKKKVTGEAALTKKLGKEKLSKMKAEVESLRRNTRRIVDEFMVDKSLWWHKKPGDLKTFSFHERASKAIRLAAGKLGPILEKYGYITTDPNDPGFWREWDDMGLNHPPNARPYYPQHLDWPESFDNMLAEYEELVRDNAHFTVEVEKLRKAKEQSDVEDLWESA